MADGWLLWYVGRQQSSGKLVMGEAFQGDGICFR